MAYISFEPSDHFNTVLWTGNATDNTSITGVGFQPDFVWGKDRSAARSHEMYDSSRGATKRIQSDSSGGESTQANNLKAFESDGFQVGTSAGLNYSGSNFVAWNWKANGGTTTSNTSGTITSTVQANTTAGFSIVTYTGNGTAGATIGHGLGAKPNMIIMKSTGHGENWAVYHENVPYSSPEDYYMSLDDTRAATDSTDMLNDTAPTSTLITLGSQDKSNKNASTHVAYCFREINGYSRFGGYTGTGSSEGTFLYCGFKPAFIIMKRTTGENWVLYDNTRDTFNPTDIYQKPNSNASDGSALSVDFLSNGVKLRGTDGMINASGGTYIFMAFAEQSIVASNGLPVTAE